MAKKDREVTFHYPEMPTEAKEIRNKDGEVTGWAAAQADWLVRMPDTGDASKTETATTIGEKTQKVADSLGGLSVKITVDTSEAVAELKRLQRVARQVTKELREVEAKFPVDILRTFTTQELADELARRAKNGEPGVRQHVINAHGSYANLSIANSTEGSVETITGPARILVVTDPYEVKPKETFKSPLTNYTMQELTEELLRRKTEAIDAGDGDITINFTSRIGERLTATMPGNAAVLFVRNEAR